MLKERLIKYIKVVSRSYRSDATANQIRAALEDLNSFVEASLAGIVEVRGTHVHSTRFSDEDLDRLDTLDFVTLHVVEPKSSTATFRRYYLQEYRKIRVKWRKTVRTNNVALNTLMNRVSEVFLSTVFSASDQVLRPPSNL